MQVSNVIKKIHWLGHDSICLEGSVLVCFDPFRIEASRKVDLILISHDHFDHCSPEDVEKVRGKDTVIVTDASSATKFKGDVRVVAPGDRIKVKGVEIEVWPAYNTDKEFHPRDAGMLSFVVVLDGIRYYHAGDTDHIPEMADLKVDVAFLPVSGTYVMTADQAVGAARIIKPGLAVPMHYGAIVGTVEDALAFKRALEGEIEVAVFERTAL